MPIRNLAKFRDFTDITKLQILVLFCLKFTAKFRDFTDISNLQNLKLFRVPKGIASIGLQPNFAILRISVICKFFKNFFLRKKKIRQFYYNNKEKKKFLNGLSKLKTRRLGRFLISPLVISKKKKFQNFQFADIRKIAKFGRLKD